MAIHDIRLDPGSPLAIHEQICQALRTAIWSGELPPGSLLPTSRELARHLGVARNTVVVAYTRLVAEGFCTSNTRRGTRVVAEIPVPPRYLEGRATARDASERPTSAGASVRLAFGAQDMLGSHVNRLGAGVPFAMQASDPALYPRTKLGRRLADKFLSAPRMDLLSSAAASGPTRFQMAIANYLRQSRGVVCNPLQVIAVSRMESALGLTTRALIDPGDTIKLEDPAADVVQSAMRAARGNLVPVPCDAHGADLSAVTAPPAKLIFVSPSVSFPFGVQMSERRRHEILGIAQKENAVIFENDICGDLRYSGARIRSLQGLDGEGRVIHYGSFFETLGNSVDVAYMVVPLSLVDAFNEIRQRMAQEPPAQVQDAIAEFIEEHEYAAHARNVRAVFASRLETVKQAMRDVLPSARLSEPLGGLHVVLELGADTDVPGACESAAALGLPVRPLSRFYLGTDAPNGIVFGFGAVAERAIAPMIRQLAGVIHSPK